MRSTNTFAEDVVLEFKEGTAVQLNYAFRLQPESGPIAIQELLHLGPILQDTPLNVLFEFLVQPSASKADLVTLLDGTLKMVVSSAPNSRAAHPPQARTGSGRVPEE